MKALAFALALVAAPMTMAVTGCETFQTQEGSQRALYTAALAYEGALDTVKAAADAGTLRGENAVKAKAILDQANTALQAARTSQSASGARRVLIILASLEAYTNGR